MQAFRKISWHQSVCQPLLVVAFALVCAIGASAQTTAASEFQFSTLTGSGNTITATRLPVIVSGKTSYVNVTLLFNVDATGKLTLAAGYPKIVPSPTPVVTNFLAGNYSGPAVDVNFLLGVSGPGVAGGGATEWSLASSANAAECMYPTSATWYVGTIAQNPLATRLKAAGITSTAWSYGIGGSLCGGTNWQPKTLLGFSQTNNAITIVSFTNNGVDSNVPVDQITYTLLP